MTAKITSKAPVTKRPSGKGRVAPKSPAKITNKQMIALFRSMASDLLPEGTDTIASVKVINSSGAQDWIFLTQEESGDGEKVRIARFTGPASMLPVKAKAVRKMIKAAPTVDPKMEEDEDISTRSESSPSHSSPPVDTTRRRKMPPRAARPHQMSSSRHPTPGPSGTTGKEVLNVHDLVQSIGRVNLSAGRHASTDFDSDSEPETEIETTKVAAATTADRK